MTLLLLLAACGTAPEISQETDAVEVVGEAPDGTIAGQDPGAIRAPLTKPGSKFTGAPELDPRRGPPTRAPEAADGPPSDGFTFEKGAGYSFEDTTAEDEGFTFDEDQPPLPRGLKWLEPQDAEHYEPRPELAGAMLALLLWAGCQEPFGVDRHDLVGFRIAAIETRPGAEAWLEARAALIVDGRPWSDEPALLAWSWTRASVDDVAALDPDDEADAVGPAPALAAPPAGLRRLGLVARSPEGEVRRAYVDVGRTPAAGPALVGIDAPDLVASGERVRVSALLEPVSEPLLRWMSVDGAGTFTELTRTEARWEAAEVTLDDGEVVDRERLRPGMVTVVGLAIEGGNAFVAREIEVGEVASTGLWTTSGRFVPTDVAVAGLVRGTLVADDDAPSGLALTGATEVSTLPDVDPYGTEALSCVGVAGPFDPTWLLDGRCTRRDVAGATVVLDGR